MEYEKCYQFITQDPKYLVGDSVSMYFEPKIKKIKFYDILRD
jgi:hypothetical protein